MGEEQVDQEIVAIIQAAEDYSAETRDWKTGVGM